MKKSLIVLAISTAAVASSFAQGYVTFGNGTSSKISVNTTFGGTTFAATGVTANSYYFALFYSATATSAIGANVVGENGDNTASFVVSDSNWTLDPGVLGVNGTRAGFMGDATGSSQTVVPIASGDPANFVVIGWSANIGSTEQSLVNFLNGNDNGVTSGWVGESNVGGPILTSPGAPSPVASIFGAVGAGDVDGFSLGEMMPTPEPTTMALGAMGALSLLAFRRKKA